MYSPLYSFKDSVAYLLTCIYYLSSFVRCVCMCARARKCRCTHATRLWVSVLAYAVFEAESPVASLLDRQVLGLQIHATMSAFHIDSRYSISDPHAYSASTLPLSRLTSPRLAFLLLVNALIKFLRVNM